VLHAWEEMEKDETSAHELRLAPLPAFLLYCS
jgi:hypothetical protein